MKGERGGRGEWKGEGRKGEGCRTVHTPTRQHPHTSFHIFTLHFHTVPTT